MLTTSSAVEIASRVATRLNLSAEVLVTHCFPNGQIEVVPPRPRSGIDEICLFQCFPDRVNDRLVELLLALQAISFLSPRQLTIVLPYLPYTRSDKPVSEGAFIPFTAIAHCLQQFGITRLVTAELHVPQLSAAFGFPVVEVDMMPIFAQHLHPVDGGATVVVSPDLGGAKRAERLATALGVPMAVMRKTRHGSVKESIEILGQVKHKCAILVDDEVNSGESLISAAQLALRAGATAAIAVVVHPLLTPEAIGRIEQSPLQHIFMSDSIPLISASTQTSKMKVLSLAEVLAEVLHPVAKFAAS
ncbi:ribose-phosphate diphosphokinase [Synechococcales cyanobacterium C]|uniref:Ribose-phosphate diphosphokinase n=1 Tax=Petrachloros mirabilis ULC683 TaxID=2781853 RepID=A0A8K2A0K6_9CYAN|nr:ribose-phosphate diphosphokinase [Petrachloros mirabilis ULC683]